MNFVCFLPAVSISDFVLMLSFSRSYIQGKPSKNIARGKPRFPKKGQPEKTFSKHFPADAYMGLKRRNCNLQQDYLYPSFKKSADITALKHF
jgi:hypothetical protein